MDTIKLARPCLLAALIVGPGTALACGEMMFNAGKGLPFQSYLAPRSAEVLILYDAEAGQGEYYAALEKAGHRLTLVTDADEMAAELQQNRYDIVIAAFDSMDELTPRRVASNTASVPRLLPVVARSLRKSPQVLERFDQFLVDGASVGQYLTMINRVLASAR